MKLARGAMVRLLACCATVGLALTGCVSAESLISSPTKMAKGPAPDAPQTRLGTDWQAPEPSARRPFDRDKTVVSLTFDDGNASQYAAVEAMEDLGLKGTFFVNSSVLDTEGYLSRVQLDTMVANGHEIGGHSLQHRNLRFLDEDEMLRQICWDRENLLTWGYQVTNYAFPEAGTNKAIEEAVEACGYNSARGLGAVASVIGCEQCGAGESFAPKDPYRTRAPAMVDPDWSLQDMKDVVLNAEKTNADWVQLTFHHFCPEACNEVSTDLDQFKEFLQWLAARERTDGTAVRTVDEVIGGAVQPVGTAPSRIAQTEGNLVVNSNFSEPPRVDDFRRCWQGARYGNNDGVAEVSANGVGGGDGVNLKLTRYTDGDVKFLQRLDLGECAPQVIPGTRYKMTATYNSTTNTQFVVYLRDAQGDWLYWTASDWFAPSEEAGEATWIAPEIPEGFTGLSFGMSIFSPGEMNADDIEMSVYTD